MRKNYRVYLDTNIIICGYEKSEYEIIKEFINEGKILAYGSMDVQYEQEYKSTEHYFSELKERQDSNSFMYDFLGCLPLIDAMQKQKQLVDLEKQESDYWNDCEIQNIVTLYDLRAFLSLINPNYTIDNYFSMCINIQGDLVNNYGIKIKDSFHIMHCLLGKIDILLTNDKDLIKNTKKVPWIKFEIMNVKDFIKFMKENNNY